MGGRDAIEKHASETIPMGGWASVEEIAEAILFLASDRSSFMTGHAMVIAIATMQDEVLRVETARRALADPVRGAVQAALGARVRYRARTKENPVEVCLNAE